MCDNLLPCSGIRGTDFIRAVLVDVILWHLDAHDTKSWSRSISSVYLPDDSGYGLQNHQENGEILMIRTYTTGKQPTNPVMHEKYVFLISDVRAEPPNPECPDVAVWSYVIDEQLTYPEYIDRMKEKAEIDQMANDAALLELDADICALYDIVEEREVSCQ